LKSFFSKSKPWRVQHNKTVSCVDDQGFLVRPIVAVRIHGFVPTSLRGPGFIFGVAIFLVGDIRKLAA
jgi:hypothetical protein